MKLLPVFVMLVVGLPAMNLVAQNDPASSSVYQGGEGVNGDVLAMTVQSDGKVVIGGKFSAVNGIACNNIARINPDGSLDRKFSDKSAPGINGTVNALVAQPGGGVIAGGSFNQAGNGTLQNIARFNADGTLDKKFGGPQGASGVNGSVQALAIQADGKILIGGNFTTVMGQERRSLARLKADGTIDSPVVTAAISGEIQAFGITPKAVIATGDFTVGNQEARNILRISTTEKE